MIHLIKAPIFQCNNIVHGFFTRYGGVSVGSYKSLNISLQNDICDSVQINRARCISYLKSDSLILMNQIHSARVCIVNQSENFICDGLVTKKAGLLLGVMTADCAPVLFADVKHRIVGVCHAGWRGAFAGIIDNMIASMIALGAKRYEIFVALGPMIAVSNYEVGVDFPAPIVQIKKKYFFDLSLWIKNRLNLLGVDTIYDVQENTFSQPKKFFSYRYAQQLVFKETGRQLSAIGLIS